ncbi:imidazole glycerol phosphate synthase subunit HisH [Fontisubflavum oceani]|uniref:imidazole glycerol phosphate synthase subunit HisH n=1 Tax=Fontisubflavum oceani TaxID=2978973 RepID=UPI0025B496AC|nr:imidazole glycerol phosphate synthase subunit HisH [Fontisubflavum oceani]WJY23322.1 imidazole glycerol phosphate synthase subunit HisH [Fontisubflavum oceani]
MRFDAQFVTEPAALDSVDRIILPGVGNFADCAARLRLAGWDEGLRQAVSENGKPLLGICVGMQLLASHSTEGNDADRSPHGLGFIPGHVRHLRQEGSAERAPHVGWNSVEPSPSAGAIFAGIPEGTDFYFVHSYVFRPDDATHVVAQTRYGAPLPVAVRRGRVFGTQFHPEKSSRAGMRLLRNFAETPWD